MTNRQAIALGLAGGIASVALVAGPAGAQQAGPAHPVPERLFNATVKEKAPGEDLVAAGRLVASGGARQGGAAMACFTCHGADGAGDAAGAVPRIAGMPAWYTYKQLNDYASGSRNNAAMTGIARQLTESEREAVAAYYALVDAPHPPKPPADDIRTLQWGQQLAAVGSTDRALPACLNCHGPDGSGLPPSVPGLAGQHAEYLALQLRLFRSGERDNDPQDVMHAVAKKLSDEDIHALAAYYSRVRIGGETPRAEAGR